MAEDRQRGGGERGGLGPLKTGRLPPLLPLNPTERKKKKKKEKEEEKRKAVSQKISCNEQLRL